MSISVYPAPSSGGGNFSLIGTAILRKSTTLSGLAVGNNNLITIAGGLVRIELFAMRPSTNAASAGAPTLNLNWQGGTSFLRAAFALADLTTTKHLISANSAANLDTTTGAAGVGAEASLVTGHDTVGSSLQGTGLILLDSNISSTALQGVVAVTTYSGGVLDWTIIYTPITLGATLS